MYKGGVIDKQMGVIYTNDSDIRQNPFRTRRSKRIFFSSLNENKSTDNVYSFSIDIPSSECKNVVQINPIRMVASYTVPAAVIYNGFIDFVDIDSECIASRDSTKHHATFPVTQGAEAATVVFSHSFSDLYSCTLKTPVKIQKELKVRVLKESSASGALENFTDLGYFSLEVELVYEEHNPFL